MHEDFTRASETGGSSDRSFGMVFGGAFLLLGLSPLLHRQPPRAWTFPVAAGFLLLALARPAALAPLNRLWIRIGLLLQGIVSPLVLGVLFFLTVTPIGTL